MAKTNETKTLRITKAMRFEDIKVLLTGEGEVKHGTTAEIAVDFINNELSLLAKKNVSKDGSKKQTAVQKQNEKYKAQIMEFLATREDDSGMTCTAIGSSIPDLVEAGYGTSKFSSLCNALVDEGKLTKSTVKGKVLFSLA